MSTRPNFVFLQMEDVGLHQGCYGDPAGRTPCIDQLAAEGARFTQAISHAPVCAPSRGGMVTGCYPWSIGNQDMRCGLLHPPRCFTHELRDAGYHVSWPTKLDFNFEPGTGWCTDQEEWWTRPAPKQPFFVYRNFGYTHESRMFPDNIREMWQNIPAELAHIPKPDPADMEVPPYLTDCPEVREQLVSYYYALSVIDHQIGQCLDWIEEQGVADNTVVILMSDHGRGLPREKRWLYDAGIHLPLIVRDPDYLTDGILVDDLTAWVDLAPTVLARAGVDIPGHYQGQVAWGEQAPPPRECVFAGRDRMDIVFDRSRAVRDQQWHYIRNDFPELPWARWQGYMEQQNVMPVMREKYRQGALSGDEAVFFADHKPAEELYDPVADPHMVHNLAPDPRYQDVLVRMRKRLDDLETRIGDVAKVDERERMAQGLVNDYLGANSGRYTLCPDPALTPAPLDGPNTLEEALAYRASLGA